MNPTTLRQVTLPTNLPFSARPIIDITDKLPIGPEGDWLTAPTRRKDGMLDTGPRDYADVKQISVHHSAVNGDIYGHANYHVFKKKRPGVCYHMYVKVDQLYQTNDLLALIWHVANNNYDTVSICVEGDFTKRNMTEMERKTLYAGILTLQKYFPDAELVLGHNEYENLPQWTACPGFDMVRVRDDIYKLRQRMEYEKSSEYAKETAYKAGNQVLYFFDLIKNGNEGQKKWAINEMLDMAPAFKKKGWIK